MILACSRCIALDDDGSHLSRGLMLWVQMPKRAGVAEQLGFSNPRLKLHLHQLIGRHHVVS
jgi:hypothetical protein